MTQILENPVTPETPVTPVTPVAPVTPAAPVDFSWKTQLAPDYANSPSMQKFPDTKDGFNEAVKSHLSLEKLLGNEKVPIPKSADDKAAWDIFKKAFRIPEKAEGYGLADVNTPESLKGVTFDKSKFAEVVHKHNLTPEQAKGLWGAYTEMVQQSFSGATQAHQAKITEVINGLRSEWGDAYESKVELGQMVINKFSDNKEMNDFITATLSKDPQGIKFLAKIGDQFAENKVGDFKYQRHSLTPDEAQKEIDTIRQDSKHPYNNDKASPAERDRAIDYVNSLIAVVKRPKG